MTTVSKYKCDFCGKEVADRYVEEGWIHLDKASMTISICRLEDRTAVSAYADNRSRDFCGIGCLIAFITQLVEDRERSMKD